MAHINIDNRILNNFNDDDLAFVLNQMIDNELSKETDKIDTVFVDECVNALIELEQEDNKSAIIIPLMSSEKFLKKITENKMAKSFKSLNVFSRVAVVAAIIAGSTMTANATVEAVTGVNVLQNVANSVQSKLIEWGVIEDIDAGLIDDEPVTEPTTEPTTKPTTTKPTTTKPSVIEDVDGGLFDDEETTKKGTVIEDIDGGMFDDEETTKKDTGIEDVDGGMFDDEETTTEPTTEPTTRPRPTRPSTTQQTTATPVIEPTTEDKEEAVFTGMRAEYDESFKFDYIYGEELSYDGLTLIASYSDGTEEEIPLDDCKYTKAIDTTVTEDYELVIVYKTSTLKINVTVRPDDFTRGSEVCSSRYYDYLLTEDGACITEYKGYSDFIELDEIDGNRVIAIGPSCFKDRSIQSFTAQNVTRLYGNAFENCRMMTNCYTPSLTYIGDYAFNNCELLDRAVFSEELDYIGKYAYNKTALEEIIIPSGVTAIYDYTFNECANLRTVEMLGIVTTIGNNAFNECTALESVTGCADITEVGDFAFSNDELVEFDIFPQGLERVGTSAFYFCRGLTIGALPAAIKELSPSAFAYCQGMTEIVIPEGISIIPDNCFRATNAATIILPEGITEIREYAFMSCKAKAVTLPQSLRRLGTYSMYSVLLRNVYFGTSIEAIGENAFYAGKSVTFHLYENSIPMEYAMENGIKYDLLDGTAE